MRDDIFTSEMVAEMCGCSANHVRDLVKAGRLASFRLGSRCICTQLAMIDENLCRSGAFAFQASRLHGSAQGDL